MHSTLKQSFIRNKVLFFDIIRNKVLFLIMFLNEIIKFMRFLNLFCSQVYACFLDLLDFIGMIKLIVFLQ